MLTAKLTAKGQITVPRAVREKLGLSPGEYLLFVERDGEFSMRKVLKQSPFDRWVGYLGHRRGASTDTILEELRGE